MLSLTTVLLIAGLSPAAARADDDDKVPYDARIQGYTKTVELPSSSTGLTYFLLVVLGGICFGVMFMDAKRSHLD